MKGQKLIIGVRHVDEKELNEVNALLFQRRPLNVGLELPEDYLQREERGIGTSFFGDINSYLINVGISVLYLESSAAWDTHQTIDIARAVLECRVREGDLRKKLNKINEDLAKNSQYTAPELLHQLKFFRERYKKALDIVAGIYSMEEITELWNSSNAKREAHVFYRIFNDKPEIVVIGDGHARKLKDSLAEYDYIRLYL